MHTNTVREKHLLTAQSSAPAGLQLLCAQQQYGFAGREDVADQWPQEAWADYGAIRPFAQLESAAVPEAGIFHRYIRACRHDIIRMTIPDPVNDDRMAAGNFKQVQQSQH